MNTITVLITITIIVIIAYEVFGFAVIRKQVRYIVALSVRRARSGQSAVRSDPTTRRLRLTVFAENTAQARVMYSRLGLPDAPAYVVMKVHCATKLARESGNAFGYKFEVETAKIIDVSNAIESAVAAFGAGFATGSAGVEAWSAPGPNEYQAGQWMQT